MRELETFIYLQMSCCLQQSKFIMHHKNCTSDIIRKLKATPIKKNMIIKTVDAIKSSKVNAASVVIIVPTEPAIRLFPYAHIHFFSAGEKFVLARGIRGKSVNKTAAPIPKDIQSATIALVNIPRLNSTATPIPIMILIIKAVPQLQEFCLYIVIVLSIRFG